MSVPPLFDHQVTSVQFLLAHERALDGSDPGTGKTRTQIEAFAIRRRRGGKCALVLAPKSLLEPAWLDDFTKFAPQLKCSVAHAAKREEAFDEPADVYITNTDAAKWLAEQRPAFFKRFDTLIIDESSAFKHHTSQRSKAVHKIKKHFIYRYIMTGTPNTNTITDIWNQIRILDDGKRLGQSFYAFREAVCKPTQVGPQANMIKWTDRPEAEDVVASMIKDLVIRYKFEDCHDIPPNFLSERVYRLSNKQMRAYLQMEKDAVAQLSTGAVSAVNAASVMTKLLQIASGAVYDETGAYHLIDDGRAELIVDLVEQRKHTLVFFNWTHQRDRLIDELTKRGITHTVIDGTVSDKNRREAVRLFQGGFYRVLLAHPQSAAHGLTLTKATTTIWASPTYNLEHFLQGNRRIYRAGQTMKTETIVVVGDDTIESKVLLKLQDKNAKQSKTLDLLQEFFQNS
jgi:SNF2 family DNA or RNA helicase